jgi:hypothetical protein
MAWHTPRKNGRDGPSPVITKGEGNDVLLVCNMAGLANGYDAATGKELWKQRIGTGQITASPLASGRRAYFLFEAGETAVVDAAEGKVLARNTVGAEQGEIFRASPVAVGGQMFLRSDRVLYCVGSR